jgi:hypothetical protein
MSMKNSIDTIGNRAPNVPAYRAVSKPTALPRAPTVKGGYCFFVGRGGGGCCLSNHAELFSYMSVIYF